MGLQNSKRKKIVEINNYYDQLDNFECCVCFNDRKTKMKRIICGHLICEKCFLKIQDFKCPICRQEMLSIDTIKKNPIRYINDPFQENLNMDFKEILEQVDLHNIIKEDVSLIQKNIGKVALIGYINTGTIMIYYMPYYLNQWYNVLDISGENIYLLYTLIDDLKNKDYNIWYNDKLIHDTLKKYFDKI